ncbi:thiaminase II [Sphingobacterium griseoflavum]|uniref:Aminopyrimidine aminohydrolase n=1 Tax=Sphingobacterium griseoflavum TaxID=1474952 RepID=A0ABQ3HTS6_9SPHI|nr:thiaminase II [Sphingobacterium griseoflavum]GHE33563.1 aminopyrimidine aminohydrolase [Sphingobacterium griseoflavum]
MSWTDHAWKSINPLVNSILEMPFVKELRSGVLPMEKFQFYMLQDAKYLEHFGRVLAYIGSKCISNEQAQHFFDFGKNALLVEKALHETYFKQFGIPSDMDICIEPVCHHYIHFLKSMAAFESLEVAMAAVLPCFWIYQVVGDQLYQTQSGSKNPYAAWIETYSGEDFAESVDLAKSYVDQMAEQTTAAVREQMLTAFKTASHLEFLFWKAAYEEHTWT